MQCFALLPNIIGGLNTTELIIATTTVTETKPTHYGNATLIIFVILAVVLFAIFTKIHLKHRHTIRIATCNMLLGALSLIGLGLITTVTVNAYTAFVALTMGVPGAVLVTIVCKLI